ncbi:MAG: hypothetical protein KAS32_10880 [Candidatus Peribacteraceae bacterium]|nr:hypothetical protein [Candidatus Peribacteraceae bacterium]
MLMTLEFNLPDDRNDMMLALNGGKYWSVLWGLDQKCRAELKHGHGYIRVDDVLLMVREFISDNIDLTEIT